MWKFIMYIKESILIHSVLTRMMSHCWSINECLLRNITLWLSRIWFSTDIFKSWILHPSFGSIIYQGDAVRTNSNLRCKDDCKVTSQIVALNFFRETQMKNFESLTLNSEVLVWTYNCLLMFLKILTLMLLYETFCLVSLEKIRCRK